MLIIKMYPLPSLGEGGQGDEIEEGRFWSLEEINDSLGKGIFTPNFEKEFTGLVSSW